VLPLVAFYILLCVWGDESEFFFSRSHFDGMEEHGQHGQHSQRGCFVVDGRLEHDSAFSL
jgi:hypothetical protein